MIPYFKLSIKYKDLYYKNKIIKNILTKHSAKEFYQLKKLNSKGIAI